MQITTVLQFSSLPTFLLFLRTTADDYSTAAYSDTFSSKGAQITKPNCPNKCGNITVPYPFGIGVNATCSINHLFDVNCNDSFNPPKAFILDNKLEVLAIFDTKISIRNRVAWACYDAQGNVTESDDFWMNLSETPFSFSDENQLTVVGCDDASLKSRERFSSNNPTCVAICSNPQDLSSCSCSGFGCCQAPMPKGLQFISAGLRTINSHVKVHDFNPWYRCNCTVGYQGNPYLSPGCQDINECEFSPCHSKAICSNLPGTFNCSCPPNYFGDGKKNGTGCILLPPPKKTTIYAGLIAGFGLFFIMAIGFVSYKITKGRAKQRQHTFFKRNGGLLLQQQISAHDSILDKMMIFTSKELERATDKFNESRILGREGQGTVYKGMLSDRRIVAVKKSKQVDEAQVVEFINEVVILSQINHRNVVKLLGCCLETEVPLLVYEFIPNRTLYKLIHDDTTGFHFSWDLRLRIAAEIANALAYLHYATSIPLYHRDMKSNNILLDEKYIAKLSDFGISRSIAIDQTHLTTKVKGTFGYFDPEYFQTGKFTEKSDVYSFGVVLVELLTGEKPISTCVAEEEEGEEEEEEERSLVMRFLMTMEENCLKTILDPRMEEQDVNEEHLAVANLAMRCLNLNGRKRPTIREVASELESIRTTDDSSSFESKIQDLSYTETESVELNGVDKIQDLSYTETESFELSGVDTADTK
ncbi:Serine/threonine protein kinase [Handroanthus impetiginosus]|uniref:Serine/threonine protein kinase n=1 Tax=Handroanthus impetiginosus TaxID=429701 RepID=A0A2G9I9B9_9LAMI|nr:Serine/threonine protein kinase [Handroanthus impetiginosus]